MLSTFIIIIIIFGLIITSIFLAYPTMNIIFNIISISIDINTNKILKTKWEYDKKKKSLINGSVQQPRPQVII
jgi:hypothetical protein